MVRPFGGAAATAVAVCALAVALAGCGGTAKKDSDNGGAAKSDAKADPEVARPRRRLSGTSWSRPGRRERSAVGWPTCGLRALLHSTQPLRQYEPTGDRSAWDRAAARLAEAQAAGQVTEAASGQGHEEEPCV